MRILVNIGDREFTLEGAIDHVTQVDEYHGALESTQEQLTNTQFILARLLTHMHEQDKLSLVEMGDIICPLRQIKAMTVRV